MAIIIRGFFPPFCGFMDILEGAGGREGTLVVKVGTLFVVETSQPAGILALCFKPIKDQNPSVSTKLATIAFVTLMTRIAIAAQNTTL